MKNTKPIPYLGTDISNFKKGSAHFGKATDLYGLSIPVGGAIPIFDTVFQMILII